MLKREFAKLVAGTSDAAYVVDHDGVIVAWNTAAERLFGITSNEAVGKPCRGIVRGFDECGLVCSDHCTVRQHVSKRLPMQNFDLKVKTVDGEQWCNVSVMIAECRESTEPYAIHIVRRDDLRKRLEMMVCDFVISKTDLSADQVTALVSTNREQSRSNLTQREIEVLSLLALSGTTKSIADRLHVSPTTVSNHIQHILRKLDAHSRLEAIRRAERAGLI